MLDKSKYHTLEECRGFLPDNEKWSDEKVIEIRDKLYTMAMQVCDWYYQKHSDKIE